MSLEITSTCLIDKGTYVCQAKNSLGTGRASTELYVGGEYILLTFAQAKTKLKFLKQNILTYMYM